MQFLRSVSEELVASLLGTLVGFVGKTGLDYFIKWRHNLAFSDLLNFPKGEIWIIHSAMFDPSRGSYNYPSCDMIAARRIAKLLETADKKEGEGLDFRIEPESSCLTEQGSVNPEVLRRNLILLGGPKRNKVTLEVLERSAKPRYDMDLDDSRENRLHDRVTRHYLMSGRDEPDKPKLTGDKDSDEAIGHDYGLIMSMPNPFQLDRGVLVVAGIHGPGTIGAATYISDRGNLSNLSRRRQGGIIQEVVYVRYIIKYDRPVELSLV